MEKILFGVVWYLLGWHMRVYGTYAIGRSCVSRLRRIVRYEHLFAGRFKSSMFSSNGSEKYVAYL